MSLTVTFPRTHPTRAVEHVPVDGGRRLSIALWFAGIATFSALYAPQGLLTAMTADYGVSPASASLVVSAATIGLACAVLPWAWLSERIGRASAMRWAAGIAAAATLAVPLLPGFEALLVARFVQGAALGGIAALAVALLHDHLSPTRATAMAGSYVAATSIGGLSGRIVVAQFADWWGWRWGLIAIGLLCAALLLVLVGLLPADREVQDERPALADVLGHFRDPVLLSCWALGGLLIGVMAAVYNFLPFRLEAAPYSLAPTVVSLVFTAYLAGTLSSRCSGSLVRRIGPGWTLLLACAGVVAGIALTLSSWLPVMLVGLVVLTSAMFLGHAVAVGLVGARAQRARAHASALYTVAYYAGAGVFGWTAGLAWGAAGWTGVALLVGAMGVVGAVLSLVVRSRMRARS